MRIILSFEEEYRMYMEAIAAAIREFRSDAEVVVVAKQEARDLEAEVERTGTQLIIACSPIPENPVDEQLTSSIELYIETNQPSRFRVGQRYWETTNPTLAEILSVVDETKRLLRTSRE